MGIFSPKDKSYLDLYKKVSNLILESSKLLVKIVNVETKEYQDISTKMRDIELVGDTMKYEIEIWINKTFVTPFDRDDLYSISLRLDDIIDSYDKAIDIIFLYNIEDLPKRAEKQISVLEDLAVLQFAVVSGLSDIKTHADELKQIKDLVTSSEKAHRSLLGKIFNEKKDAISIIKTKELTDCLNDIAECYKAFSSACQTVMIKES